MQRLDVVCVIARTPMLEFINKTRRICINKECFTINIIEEMCDCACIESETVQCESTQENEGYDTVNLDESFIPPSITSKEEKGRMWLEEKFWQLTQEKKFEDGDFVDPREKFY